MKGRTMKVILALALLMFGALLMPTPPAQAFTTGSCQDDYNDSGNITLADVVLFGPSFNTAYPNPLFHPRFDLNASNSVTLADIVLMGPGFNLPCSGGAFVKSFGQTLYTPSNPAYRFTGVNRYNLLTIDPSSAPYRGCGSAWSDTDLVTWFDELEQQGVDSLRIWLFQLFTASGTDWSRFDHVLNLADERGIKVMPVLENQWIACTQGGNKHEPWYNTGYLAPYGNYALSLKDYTALAVNRYKNDDRILMWQVMNEAGISLSTGGCGSPAIFRAMADDTATDIQDIDPNHLVSFGTMGGGQCGAQGVDYKTLHALASIDLCEYHDYNDASDPMPGDQWNGLQVRFDQCGDLNKPLFMGEAGIDLIEEDITQQQRADYFDAKMSAFYNAGGVGYLIWSYRNRDGADDMEYTLSDPLAAVVTGY